MKGQSPLTILFKIYSELTLRKRGNFLNHANLNQNNVIIWFYLTPPTNRLQTVLVAKRKTSSFQLVQVSVLWKPCLCLECQGKQGNVNPWKRTSVSVEVKIGMNVANNLKAVRLVI